MAGLAGLACAVFATPAGAAVGTSATKLRLGTGTRAEAFLGGPEGDLWLTETSASRPDLATGVARLTPNGQLTDFPLTTPQAGVAAGIGGIAVGPDANLWFAETTANRIGRITPAGVVTEFPLPAGLSEPGAIVAGLDGALWFTAAPDRVGRIDQAGTVSSFPLGAGAEPSGIALGPDGALWIAAPGRGEVVRMTSVGATTTYTVAGTGSKPSGIAAGPDGALWFSDRAGPRIGRVGTDGSVRLFHVPSQEPTGEIASVGGILWFTTGNRIGSIAADGDTGEPACVLDADCSYRIAALAAGPDGKLWYATGLREVEGGGGTQIANAAQPGQVASFAPPRLSLRLGAGAARGRGNTASVQIGCRGGVAGQACRGRLSLATISSSGGLGKGTVLASGRYTVAPARAKRAVLRLGGAATRLLARKGRLTVRARATLVGGRGVARRLVLRVGKRR